MSKFSLAVLVAASSVLSVEARAQTAESQPTNPITILSGCLRESRADTTTANRQGEIYTLEAIEQKLPTSPAPEGTGPIRRDSRFALSFDKPVDLAKYVNHHVEVRGRILPQPSAEQGAARRTPAGAPLPGAAQQMFHVTSVKEIAPKCPASR